uniref:Ovo like zinc finger 2 n=1 Tax=Marmota marmota marmota TaxID=9994 RepID=A0A8C5YQE4_MARMA
MPKVFLVKRRSPGVTVRSWDELPDEKRADAYIPGERGAGAGPGRGGLSFSGSIFPRTLHLELVLARGVSGLSDLSCLLTSLLPYTTGTCNDSVIHSCDLCGKGFRLQRMLNRHLKCHNQVKRHLCTFCGKGFNDTFDLKRHVRTHTGIRPYKCDICNKAFTQRCSLESHLKKIHGVQQQYAYKQRRDKLYVCEDCGYTGPTQEDLYLHVNSAHPGSTFLKKTSKKLAALLQSKLMSTHQENTLLSEEEEKK